MRYARVLFTLPLPEPFDYAIPEEMHVEPGSVVRAPLGAQERMGVVWDVCEEEDGLRELKELYASYPTPAFSKPFRDFIDWSAKYTCSNPGGVLRMVLRSPASLYPSKMETVVLEKPSTETPKRLTAARERVLEFVKGNPPMTQRHKHFPA